MKKLTFILIALCFSTFGFSQMSNFVGGELGFSSNDAQSNFSFVPQYGRILNEKMVVVVGLGLRTSTVKVPTEVKSSGFALGAEFRYGWKSGDHLFVFLAPGVDFISTKIKDAKDATNSFNIGIRPGLTYVMSDHWTATAKYGYLGYNSVSTGGVSSGNFGLDINTGSLLLGINYHF